MIDINVNNIFFRSYSVDPNSGHAIYVFDSTYLPASDEIGDKQVYDLLINAPVSYTHLDVYKRQVYCLPCFSASYIESKIEMIVGL